MRFFLPILFVLLYYVAFIPSIAAAEPVHHSTATLISPISATGEETTVPVAIRVTIEKGWKTYWRTPGDAGLPPALSWTGSENFKSALIKWPAPHRFTLFDMDNFGYADDVTFPLDIALVAPGKALSLKLKLDLLVCSEICVPETHNLSLSLPEGPASSSGEAGLYKAALKKIPGKGSDEISFTSAWLEYDNENRNYLVVEATAYAPPPKGADLIAEHPSNRGFGKPSVTYDAEEHTAIFKEPAGSDASYEQLIRDLGSQNLTLTYTGGGAPIEASLPLSQKTADAFTKPATPLTKKIGEIISFRIILLALLGGLILNLMPCVLPVLSLKVLSIASHGGKDSRASIFRNFMASAAGIVTSFWIMAGALTALRAGGEIIGWGIQFQHPSFLIFLIAVVMFFAANLWGLFEIPLPRFIARNIPARH